MAGNAVKVAVVRATTPTSTGTVDLTGPAGFGTPKGAIIFGPRVADLGFSNRRDNAVASLGATDGTNEWAVFVDDRDNHVDLHATRGAYDTRCLLSAQGQGVVKVEAAFDSWITDGIRLDFPVVQTLGWHYAVLLIGGDDAAVKVGTATGHATDGTAQKVTTGSEPSGVLVVSPGLSPFDETTKITAARWSVGFCANDGSRTQRALAIEWPPNLVTAKTVAQYLASNRVATSADGTEELELTSFDSTGFWVTTRGTGSKVFGYVALDLGDDFSVEVTELQAPGSTGVQSYSGVGHQPQAGFAISSPIKVLDTVKITNDAGAFGLSLFDKSQALAASLMTQRNVDPSNSATSADLEAIHCHWHDQTSGKEQLADLQSFDEDGFSFNWTVANRENAYHFVLTIGSAPITITPDPVVVSVSLPAATVERTLLPDPVEVAVTLPAPEVSFELVPDPVVVSITLPPATVERTILPEPVVVNVALPPATVDRTLLPEPVVVAVTLPDPVVGIRTAAGLVALYAFHEGSGVDVHDISGVGTPVDLSILTPANAAWIRPNLGLALIGPNLVFANPAGKIVSMLVATDEFTLEAWIEPATPTQEGQFLGCDLGPSGFNFAMGQGIDRGASLDFGVGVRTSTSSGTELNGADGQVTGGLQHVLATRAADGTLRLYVDGVEDPASPISVPGTFDVWDPFPFLLGATAFLADDWLGTYRLVAVFDRALVALEVAQHAAAGPVVPIPLTIKPAPVVVTVTLPAPTVVFDTLTLTPAPVVVSVTLPAPTVVRTLLPDPVAVSVTLPDPAVLLDLVLTPDPVAVSVTLPAPFVDVPRTVTPSPVVVTVTLPAVSIQVEGIIQPDPVVVHVNLPEPLVLGVEEPAVEFELAIRRALLLELEVEVGAVELVLAVHPVDARELEVVRLVADRYALGATCERELGV